VQGFVEESTQMLRKSMVGGNQFYAQLKGCEEAGERVRYSTEVFSSLLILPVLPDFAETFVTIEPSPRML
jgi:hypothetical protein